MAALRSGLRKVTIDISLGDMVGRELEASFFREDLEALMGTAGMDGTYRLRWAGKNHQSERERGIYIGEALSFVVEVIHVPDGEVAEYVWHLIFSQKDTTALRDSLLRAQNGEATALPEAEASKRLEAPVSSSVSEAPVGKQNAQRVPNQEPMVLQNEEALAHSLFQLWLYSGDTPLPSQLCTEFFQRYYPVDLNPTKGVQAYYRVLADRDFLIRGEEVYQGYRSSFRLGAAGLKFLEEHRPLLQKSALVQELFAESLQKVNIQRGEIHVRIQTTESRFGTGLNHQEASQLLSAKRALYNELKVLDRLAQNLPGIIQWLAEDNPEPS